MSAFSFVGSVEPGAAACVEPQQQEVFSDAEHRLATTTVALDSETRAIKEAGGVTPFLLAQSSFSRSLWQQHLSQQYSAVEQPHGQFSHGKRPSFGDVAGLNGSPVSPAANVASKAMLT